MESKTNCFISPKKYSDSLGRFLFALRLFARATFTFRCKFKIAFFLHQNTQTPLGDFYLHFVYMWQWHLHSRVNVINLLQGLSYSPCRDSLWYLSCDLKLSLDILWQSQDGSICIDYLSLNLCQVWTYNYVDIRKSWYWLSTVFQNWVLRMRLKKEWLLDGVG